MKRIVNFRPMFLAFIGLIVGILFNILLMATSGTVAKVVVVLLGVLFFVMFTAFLLSLLVRENKSSFFVWLRLQKVTLLILIVAMIVGNGYTTLRVFDYLKYDDFIHEYEITGQISDFSVERETYTFIVLTSVLAEREGVAVPVRGKVGLYVYQVGLLGEEIFSNNTITFRGQIDKLPFENARNYLSKYENNFVYTASIVSGTYVLGEGQWQADELVREAFASVQSRYLPRDIAQLSFSLLFGGSSNLSADLMESFSVSGVVHIISVSGLHVAVLMAVLFWVLRKLRAPKWLQLLLFAILLTFYAYLCGWVSTVIRSAIMGLVLMLAMFMGEGYDALSALSFSGIIVLLISPLQLFTLGFQLSFICMFAIIALSPYVAALLRKIKLPNIITGPVAVTIAVTALTLPVVAHHFNNLAVYSVLGNLLAVPIMSVAFILLLVISLLVMALPWLSFLFAIPHILLHLSIIPFEGNCVFPTC